MSDDVLPEIERLHRLGRSAREIGIALDMETSVVKRLLLVNGLRQKSAHDGMSPTELGSLEQMAADGLSVAEMGKALRLSRPSVIRGLESLGLWTDPDEVAYMAGLGMSEDEIAENLGVTKRRVLYALARHKRSKES
jgi:DNA-binding CsgD family transcriptional regulator